MASPMQPQTETWEIRVEGPNSMASSRDLLLASAGDQVGVTMDLFKALGDTDAVDPTKNSVLSPVSVVVALAMAAAGARGATLSEIGNVLKLPEGEKMHKFISEVSGYVLADGSAAQGPEITSAGGVWVDQSLILRPKFQEVLRKDHGAEIRQANFQFKAEEEQAAMNSWVEEKTRGKIQNLFDSVSQDTRLILANALYFKGSWAKTFDEEDTKTETFYLLNGETVEVPFMSTYKKQYINEHETHKILRLPYANGLEGHRKFSLYIVLPNDKGGLPDLQKTLSPETIAEQCSPSAFSEEVTIGKFRIPKFKISTKFSAVDALANMGLKAPFSGKAEFLDMVEENNGPPLYISDVLQKAFVEVNEKGTEAAAATGIEIMLMCYVPPTNFEANHPFLFILKEDVTGIILFIGRVTNPSLSE